MRDPRLVVASVPSPVTYVARFPEFAETEAVGVPVLIPRTANLAEAVDCPPSKKSDVELLGKMMPAPCWKGLTVVPVEQGPNDGVAPPKKHSVEAPADD